MLFVCWSSIPSCSLNYFRKTIDNIINFLDRFKTDFKVDVLVNQIVKFLFISVRVEKLGWISINWGRSNNSQKDG